MRNEYRVVRTGKNGDVLNDGKFPRRWGAERVFRLTKLRKGHVIELMRWSRFRRDWRVLQRREA